MKEGLSKCNFERKKEPTGGKPQKLQKGRGKRQTGRRMPEEVALVMGVRKVWRRD